MQQPLCKFRQNSCGFPRWNSLLGLFTFWALSLFATGCGDGPPSQPGPKTKPLTGTALTIRCPDPAFAAAITPAAQSWATRTGATITLLTGSMTPGDDTDVGILNVS